MPAATAQQPNLLFVMMDQLQARALGCYGNPVTQTPQLDALAASGVLFERLFCQQPLCVPARCTLFTGRYIHAHRHRDNDSFLRPDEPHLGSILRAVGYRTGYSGKNHLLPRGRGAEDFDFWRGTDNPEEDPSWQERAARTDVSPEPPAPTPESPWPTAYYVGRSREPADAHRDARRTDAALEFLDQVAAQPEPDRPFALVVSYSGPHVPFAAPPEFYGRHHRQDIPVPPAPASALEGKPPEVAAFREFYRYDEMTPADVQEIIGTYYDYITFLDHQVGRLLHKLDDHSLRERTLVVFTADHGEFAGEFGLFEKHAASFYDCLLHVPLLVSWPGVIPANERRCDLIEHVDVLATLLDYCHVAVPEGVQGLSYAHVIAGEAHGQDGPRDAVFAEACAPAGTVPAGSMPWYRLQATAGLPVSWPGKMVRTADWKLCWRLSGMHELYDLQADPLEHTNLAGRLEYQGMQRSLEQRLLAWMIQSEDPLR